MDIARMMFDGLSEDTEFLDRYNEARIRRKLSMPDRIEAFSDHPRLQVLGHEALFSKAVEELGKAIDDREHGVGEDYIRLLHSTNETLKTKKPELDETLQRIEDKKKTPGKEGGARVFEELASSLHGEIKAARQFMCACVGGYIDVGDQVVHRRIDVENTANRMLSLLDELGDEGLDECRQAYAERAAPPGHRKNPPKIDYETWKSIFQRLDQKADVRYREKREAEEAARGRKKKMVATASVLGVLTLGSGVAYTVHWIAGSGNGSSPGTAVHVTRETGEKKDMRRRLSNLAKRFGEEGRIDSEFFSGFSADDIADAKAMLDEIYSRSPPMGKSPDLLSSYRALGLLIALSGHAGDKKALADYSVEMSDTYPTVVSAALAGDYCKSDGRIDQAVGLWEEAIRRFEDNRVKYHGMNPLAEREYMESKRELAKHAPESERIFPFAETPLDVRIDIRHNNLGTAPANMLHARILDLYRDALEHNYDAVHIDIPGLITDPNPPRTRGGLPGAIRPPGVPGQPRPVRPETPGRPIIDYRLENLLLPNPGGTNPYVLQSNVLGPSVMTYSEVNYNVTGTPKEVQGRDFRAPSEIFSGVFIIQGR